MGERAQKFSRIWLSLLLGAAALIGCASTPPVQIQAPTAEEIAAAQSAGFEVGPTRSASDLLPAERLQGASYQVSDTVITKDSINHYEISSNYGDFLVSGDELLQTRLREIEALVALDEMSTTAEFADAARNAVKTPFVATWNLITNPVDTIGGIPTEAWAAVKQASRLAQRERGELEDSGLFELIGFESKKRQIAGELAVDPYTSNKALQERLNRFAWAAYAGALPFLFVPFADQEGASTQGPATTDRLAEILLHYSPEDLRRLNRIELAVMGIPESLSDEFIRHPWYSPRHQTMLVEALAALDLTTDRAIFIQAAVTAESENEAYFYQRTAELMRGFSDHVSPVRQIVSVAGAPSGLTESNALVLPLPADYVVWDPKIAALAQAFAEKPKTQPPVANAVLVVSGAISPLARQHIEALGITIIERAFDRFHSEAEISKDASH
jgi:hypothetical protein